MTETARATPPSVAEPLLLLGNGQLAALVLAELRGDPRWRPLAVVADPEHLGEQPILGVPQLALDLALARHPPGSCSLLVTVGYARMRARAELFERARGLGYRMPPYVASRARVHPDVRLGDGAIVFDDVYVGPAAELGVQVVVRPQSYVGHEAVLGDHCFLASRVAVGGRARLGRLSFVGLGAVVRDRVRVAEECLIGAGALVVGDTEPCGVYVGHPARRVGEHRESGVVVAR